MHLFYIAAFRQSVETKWRIYALVNKAIFGSDKWWPVPVRRQGIIWTNDDVIIVLSLLSLSLSSSS